MVSNIVKAGGTEKVVVPATSEVLTGCTSVSFLSMFAACMFAAYLN